MLTRYQIRVSRGDFLQLVVYTIIRGDQPDTRILQWPIRDYLPDY